MFYGDFNSADDVFNNFNVSVQEQQGVNILFAWYGYGDYDGSAFVLFTRDNKLYEVNGGHCSCMGLEDQWEPEETSVEALRFRVEKGHLGKETYYHDGIWDEDLLKCLKLFESGKWKLWIL